MNTFVAIPLFAAFVNLALALFVFSRDMRLRVNQVFMVCGASLAIWNAGAFAMFRVTNHDQALLCARILHFGVIFIPVALLHLTTLIAKRDLKVWLGVAYGLTMLLALSNFTDLFIRDVRYIGYAWFAVAGPGFWLYSALFPAMTAPALYLLLRARRAAPPSKAQRFSTLIIASVMLLILGGHDLLPVFGYNTYPLTHLRVYPWGQFGACIYGVLVGFSVLHDQLLDVRVSLGRQAATLLRLGFLVATAYLLLTLAAVFVPGLFTPPAFLVAMAVVLVSVIIAAIVFPRLLGGESTRLEQQILGDRFEYQQQMREFIRSIRTYTEIERLFDDTLKHLKDVMRLETAAIVAFDAKTQGVRYSVTLPARAASPFEGLTADAPIFEQFRLQKARYIDTRNMSPATWARRMGQESGADLAQLKPEYVFVLANEGPPEGLVVFGRKLGELPYTRIDVEVCTSLAEQLSFAVERIRLSEQGVLNERLMTLSVMSRGLAHDLSNLTTPISIFLQLTEKRFESTPEADLHRVARRNINTINAYVKEAIFFSESHGVNLTPIAPDALLAGVAELCQQRAERRHCTIVIEDNAKLAFNGDRILLQRMLANLVHNAIDASPFESRVLLSAARLPGTRARGAWTRFLVIDHGSGIPPEHLERVWEPYWSTKTEGDVNRGFGLGLTVVQKIVLLHQGSVSIQSKVGAGTTVQVDIPCGLGEDGK